MSKAVDLREDFDADTLRRLARKSRDAGQSRRLLALAAIYEGGSRTQASRIGAVGLQTVRDWVLAFNAAGPDGLIERKKPGPRFKLDAAQRQALAVAIEEGPDLQRDGVVRWRLKDLAAWLFARFGVSLDESSVGREVKRMGYAKLSARPRHHQQDPAALTAFKKTSPPA
ncbi:IS630 family transposase ISMno21 [Methylorubrum aminovorans]|jgi:transposase|uniref:IS630 family transposase ISMno21 n=5 Tax=Methylobacteriaceae TaxID=119045 RepID=A0AA37HRH6_9HYPH|nr:transposase [Methylorubrum extorquens DSM 13060]KNY24068.1 transposase [Methylobacterium sp. ARG-1]MBB5764094.1 transposase [Methylorubrum rhodesianum]MDQ0522241.1 transposase [Methylobacterium gregans]OAH23266.1 transposase [Methylorubrum populi]GJD88497.1 IS630 family transposase ISMno21 [Methylobacterium hispanicum]GJE64955.1 IS630 family transposase ISMno21 [Methylorubrum aminovorans]GJE73091.1 IS630 family transposase ISMno21 [Methylorubrum podarium]GJE75155.1 IS630 family transposa